MADWEKLNKKFDDVIDNMTKEDWNRWKERCDKRRLERENLKLENQLLPCPFCGKIPKKMERNGNEHGDYCHIIEIEYSINCETVGCYLEDSGPDISFDSFEEAVVKWNKRNINL